MNKCKQTAKITTEVIQDVSSFVCFRTLNPKACGISLISNSNLGRNTIERTTEHVCKLVTQPKNTRK